MVLLCGENPTEGLLVGVPPSGPGKRVSLWGVSPLVFTNVVFTCAKEHASVPP